jgi:xanthine dehydrogenase YagS FAD-binding subunit
MQRTRCPYFQDGASACNRRVPGSGCDALGGENRHHAILGWSEHCIATHPSDVCVPLVMLDAIVEVQGPQGGREITLEALHTLPGTTPHRETVLSPGELIVAVRIPDATALSGHQRYLKLRERTSYAFALVSASAALDLQGGTVRQARLALGGVAAKPWRAHDAEAVLTGARPTADTLAEAANRALAEARPSGDNAHKIELARGIIMRALTLALDGTPDEMPALPASPFGQSAGVRHVA